MTLYLVILVYLFIQVLILSTVKLCYSITYDIPVCDIMNYCTTKRIISRQTILYIIQFGICGNLLCFNNSF